MVVKIVYDELVNLLGSSNADINLNAVPPVPMMMVGLQGSGKTTSTAKLAKYLEDNKKKKVMMVSLDIYRPAAQEQLKVLAEQVQVDFFNHNFNSTKQIVSETLEYAQKNLFDIIILDTAGRVEKFKQKYGM